MVLWLVQFLDMLSNMSFRVEARALWEKVCLVGKRTRMDLLMVHGN